MGVWDGAALAIFLLAWLFYSPIRSVAMRGRPAINADMEPIRRAWMAQMLRRDNRIGDAALLGHVINAGSFFASTNLLLIAAAAGLLFGGADSLDAVRDVAVVAPGPAWLIEAKIGLVMLVLARGLLAFVWAIRQFIYCVALLGAAPAVTEPEAHEAFALAIARVLDPGMAAFNRGVRGYYFALAAAAWLAGAAAFGFSVLAVVTLLAWRQSASPAAKGVRAARDLIEAAPSSNDAAPKP